MRLIDADELRRQMYHEAFETDSDMQRWDGGCWIRYKMFENCIETQPTIDAVPVKHGRWIPIPDSKPFQVYRCSQCVGSAHMVLTGCLMDRHLESNLSRYCPHCGAKMDGGGKF